MEVDTYGPHGSPARFDGDRRRDARLLTEKRIVFLRLTGRAIAERPFEVLGLVARATARGGHGRLTATIHLFEVDGDGKPV